MKLSLNQISTSMISEVISKVKEIWEKLNQEYMIILLNQYQANYKNVLTMKGT